jgi:hypothetical protein
LGNLGGERQNHGPSLIADEDPFKAVKRKT